MKEMLRIWKSLHQTGYCEGIEISQEIRDSWARCKEYGVDPFKPRCEIILTPDELEERRNQNKALMEQGTSMIEHLNHFMKKHDFLFFLQDCDNYVLSRTGNKEALEFAAIANLIEGSNWSEQVMGTNTGSMAIVSETPVQFFGYENYCRVAAYSCSASSPIFDEGGKLIGLLGVSGPITLVNRHTLGMVLAASCAIERQMAFQHSLQQSEMANLHKTAIMESMSDGVLTLDHQHRITHLNLIAARNLGIDYANSVGKILEDIMHPDNAFFFSKIFSNKRILNEPLVIRHKTNMVKTAVSCTPLAEKNNKAAGTVVILQPIQQYKRLIERVSGARAKISFENIIGRNVHFKYALNCAEIAAESDSNVLLLGESGVGKDMFAQAIHNASNRCEEPFFAINCAALPRELISSELFGYEEGAFTGARKGGNPGKFELADQGTIFLDEIGEMPLDLQGSLLRCLEDGTLVRLGGREVIPVNVRIIAASNKNLFEEVQKGNFRLDLYYRLGVMDIRIPPLRERPDDIPELVNHFIKCTGPKLGKQIKGISDNAMELLMNYTWPGNVRELNNVIERAINMAPDPVLSGSLFPLLPQISEEPPAALPLKATKKSVEEQAIKSCLRKHSNNRNKTAAELGISRVTLYRKMVKYGMISPHMGNRSR
ncbi:MAG: sigma 54-interacting transcriptional regulator [Syntrophomonadaceae bacterium]|nr:sigma 54-interacting transcriptional regulator [Syntrophomonadaceae bacterium]